jgi:hypothetical protein
MFRILCDPSSGSTERCLTEISRSDSQIFVVCLVGAWQRTLPNTTPQPIYPWEL